MNIAKTTQVLLLCWGTVAGAPQNLNSLDYDYFDPNPTYEFAWEVNNKETFDEKRHQETLKDGTVEGSYSYLRPDGKMQIVTYSANDETGFVVNIETVDVIEPFGKAGRPKSADSSFSAGSAKVLNNAAAYSASSSTSSQSSSGTSRSLSSINSRRESFNSRSSVANQDAKLVGSSNRNTFSSNSRNLNTNNIQRQSTPFSSQNIGGSNRNTLNSNSRDLNTKNIQRQPTPSISQNIGSSNRNTFKSNSRNLNKNNIQRQSTLSSSQNIGSSNRNTFSSNSQNLNANNIEWQSTLSKSQNQKSKQKLAEQQLLNRQIQAQQEIQQAQIQELARIQEQNIRVQQQQQQQQFAQQQERITQQQRQQQFNTQQQFNQQQQQQFHQELQSNSKSISQLPQQQTVRQPNQNQRFSQQNNQQQGVTLRQKNFQKELKSQKVPQVQLQRPSIQSRNEIQQTFGQDVRQVLGQPVIPGRAKQTESQVRLQARIIPATVIPFPSQVSNVGLNLSPVILARPTINRARPSTASSLFNTNTRTPLSSFSTTTSRETLSPPIVETITGKTLIQNSPTLAPIVRSKSKSSDQTGNRSQNSRIVNRNNNIGRQLNQKKRGNGVAYVSFNSPTHEYSYPINR